MQKLTYSKLWEAVGGGELFLAIGVLLLATSAWAGPPKLAQDLEGWHNPDQKIEVMVKFISPDRDAQAALANTGLATKTAQSPIAAFDPATGKVYLADDSATVWGSNTVWVSTVIRSSVAVWGS